METYTVERDNERTIKFKGEQIGSASTAEHLCRWTELALYQTTAGKYICEKIDRTNWQGEENTYSGAICESTKEVMEYFGMTWVAKELYDEAGIDASFEVA